MTTLACHQPEFLPYLGFWHKMKRSDKFVFLDDVQFQHGGMQNRNMISGNKWITVPVIHTGAPQAINRVKIFKGDPWGKRAMETLRRTYGKAPHFDEHQEFLKLLFEHPWSYLDNLNAAAIDYVFFRLLDDSVLTKGGLFHASDLPLPANANLRIIRMCQQLEADVYLSGPGGKNYLDAKQFSDVGIRIEYTDFTPPDNLSVLHHLLTRSVDEIKGMIA